MKKSALISVYNKTGITDLARILEKKGYDIISTGGTAKALMDAGVSVVPIQTVTGNPESFDGRMKTISFQVGSGILYDRSKPSHNKQAKQLHVPRIDVVICNLYPFEETVAKSGVTMEEAIENIDVGGPTMVRAAAKNHTHVVVVVDPSDYKDVGDAIQQNKLTSFLRQKLAAKAFAHVAYYDAQIARYFGADIFPQELTFPLKRTMPLRYGDNPDQEAVVYLSAGVDSPIRHLNRLEGRELSATNVTDVDAGIKAVSLFKKPAGVVIKHNSPCGIAIGDSVEKALERALLADSESAFGGVVVLNTPLTVGAAKKIAAFKKAGKGQMDIVAAPGVDDQALKLLSEVRKSTGIYVFKLAPHKTITSLHVRWIDGGAVIQTENDPEKSFSAWKVVTKKKPTKKQLELMKIGWKFASRIRSNTILIMDSTLPMTRGIGAGQTSRVLSVKIALERAGKYANGGILVSDSFFPFDDSVRLAAKAGIAAIVQQGGSINDSASIEAADKAGIPMVFTGQRIFWH